MASQWMMRFFAVVHLGWLNNWDETAGQVFRTDFVYALQTARFVRSEGG